MRFIKLQVILLTFGLVLISLSCRKLLEPRRSEALLSSAWLFGNPEMADSAVRSIYGQLHSPVLGIGSGALTIYCGLAADELQYAVPQASDGYAFEINSVTPNNSIIAQAFWGDAYRMLYQVNASLEGLEASETMTLAQKNGLVAELLLIRAWLYMQLQHIFGPVPLITSTGYAENAEKPRTGTAQVQEQILADLEAAALRQRLVAGVAVRVDRKAIYAMLAKTHAIMGKWQQVLNDIDTLLEGNAYSLETNAADIFKLGSKEILLRWPAFEEGSNTTEGRNLLPDSTPGTLPRFVINPLLLRSFESGDRRRTDWIGEKQIGNKTYYYMRKYRQRMPGAIPHEECVVIRTAEIALLQAEALLQSGDVAAARAVLNSLRARAGLPELSDSTTEQLYARLMQERRIELMGEGGHRWQDLKRWGLLDSVLGAVKPGWKSYYRVFPVPANEILLNPNLSQNPGYSQ